MLSIIPICGMNNFQRKKHIMKRSPTQSQYFFAATSVALMSPLAILEMHPMGGPWSLWKAGTKWEQFWKEWCMNKEHSLTSPLPCGKLLCDARLRCKESLQSGKNGLAMQSLIAIHRIFTDQSYPTGTNWSCGKKNMTFARLLVGVSFVLSYSFPFFNAWGYTKGGYLRPQFEAKTLSWTGTICWFWVANKSNSTINIHHQPNTYSVSTS